MKKFLKVALVACACALIAVPFAGCDVGDKKFKVSEAQWTAALSVDKYAYSVANSNPASSSSTIYVDGNLAKQISVSQNALNTTTMYLQKSGDFSHLFNLNPTINKWERTTISAPFESLTLKNMSNLDYSQFSYDDDDKAYEAENYLLTGSTPQLFEEIQVEFKNKDIKKITYTSNNTTTVISFLSNDFTISLPQNILYNEATEAEWNAATNASKYAFSIALSSTRTDTYYVDGDLMKAVRVDTVEGTTTVYAEKDGEGTCYYRYNEGTQTWYTDPSTEKFVDVTHKALISAFEYADFEYDESDKCYKAQDITISQMTLNEAQVYFENGKLVKVVYYYDSTDPAQPGVEVDTTIVFLSTDFTISLPSVS